MLDRVDYVVVDELGMDPLRDKRFDAVSSVVSYELFTVTEATKHNAPLISDLFYRTIDFWTDILYYNGYADNFALEEGTRIKIPNINELTSALAKLNTDIVLARI